MRTTHAAACRQPLCAHLTRDPAGKISPFGAVAGQSYTWRVLRCSSSTRNLAGQPLVPSSRRVGAGCQAGART